MVADAAGHSVSVLAGRALPALPCTCWPAVCPTLHLSCCRAEAARVELDSRLKAVCKENEVQCNSLASGCAQVMRDLQEAREHADSRHQQIQASCCMLQLQ